jgi:hypothetical protein
LLVRGLQEKLAQQFPIFYSYIFFVLVSEFVRFSVYRWHPTHYFQVYWATQFLSLAIGSALIFEIYRVGLRSFPGTARMSRYLLLIVFGTIFAKTLANPSGGLSLWLSRTCVELERNLRIVQALAIVTLISLFLWYAIPFGRNLKGILYGYGFFITTSVVQFTMWYLSWGNFKLWWSDVNAASYIVVLVLWANALWSMHAVPEAKSTIQLEDDYEALVASTRREFRRTLMRLGWAAHL